MDETPKRVVRRKELSLIALGIALANAKSAERLTSDLVHPDVLMAAQGVQAKRSGGDGARLKAFLVAMGCPDSANGLASEVVYATLEAERDAIRGTIERLARAYTQGLS